MPWLLYFGTLSYPFFFDDLANIVCNLDIKDLSSISKRLIYPSGFGMGQNDPSRPVTFLTYALNFSLGGLTPFGYRLVNLLIHSCVSLIIFFLTQRFIQLNSPLLKGTETQQSPLLEGMSPQRSPLLEGMITHWSPLLEKERVRVRIAFLVAFLFTIHPIHIEVATYISGRADGIATLFYLLSLLFFLKSEDNRIYAALSLLTFSLSFWSKPIGVTFPIMVLIFDLLFLPKSDFRKRIWTHISYWVLLAGFLIFRVLYLGGLGDRITDPFAQWTRISYLLTQPYCVIKYIQLLLFPIGQSVDHFVPPSLGILDLKTVVGLGCLSALIFLTYLFGKKFPPYSKWIWFSFLWFFITLSPTSSIFPINDAMTERRLYLPSWGFFLAVALFYQILFSPSSSPRRKLGTVPLGTVPNFPSITILLIHLLILSYLSWKRSYLFKDPLTPWKEAVQLYPQNPRAQYNLGNEYLGLKNFPQAKQHYEAALHLKATLAEPHNNLGLISLTEGNFKQAESHFKTALQLNPNLKDARLNLENLYSQLKLKN